MLLACVLGILLTAGCASSAADSASSGGESAQEGTASGQNDDSDDGETESEEGSSGEASGSDDSAASDSSSAGSGTEESAEAVTKYSFYFDTVCSITVYGMDKAAYQEFAGDEALSSFEDAAADVISDAFSLCIYYENLLSRTVEGSDIWNINHAEGGAVACDPETVTIVQMGIDYGDLSGGRFDITIGPVSDLWNFTSTDEEPVIPDDDDLEEALAHVDYRTVQVDEDAGTVQLLDADAQIDLGGIAKGYIADAVCDLLRGEGVVSAIVSLGGNIACVGSKPLVYGFQSSDAEYKSFNIGIESPYSDMTSIIGYSAVDDGTMVTSGVYERYFTVDDVEYHHILDVDTGYPVDTDVVGVSILGGAGTSVDCDALATICLILGSEEGYALIDAQEGLEAAFILTDGSILTTDGMDFTATE